MAALSRGAAWVFNLDADLELAAGDRYAPPAGVKRATEAWASVLARTLLGPDDVVVDEETPAGSAAGRPGRAFCPTPRAIALLHRAGAIPEPHPPSSVLRRVASRAFGASLGTTMPASAFVADLDAAERRLASPPPFGNGWRIKRAFGMAGRRHRLAARRAPTAADLDFVRAGLREGGVLIEPNVEIVREYALHGRLDPSGLLAEGRLVVQRCERSGAWIETMPADEEDVGRVGAAIRAELLRVGPALHEAGYFGPFGIDAFTFRGESGRVVLVPRSEINARYTMGFAVGLSPRR